MSWGKIIVDFQSWLIHNVRKFYIWMLVSGFASTIFKMLSHKYNIPGIYQLPVSMVLMLIIFFLIPSDN
jgi:hypothetical protein